jgi:hypothetical protein
MRQITYASAEHQAIIDTYLSLCMQFAKEVSTKAKYEAYLDVLDIILEYSNNYGSGTRENNWYDWLLIIPINTSVATNGFFAGLVTKSNRPTINSYKLVLDEMIAEVVDKIDNLKEYNE